MSFPKLNSHLKEALNRIGFESALPFQSECLAPIKSGSHIICLASEGKGKTTSLIISVLQKLGTNAVGEAPRALIFVRDKGEALALEEAFKPFIRFTDLRIFSAFDQHDITGQKDTIYHGVDILIGTPSRLSQLFFLNGVNMSQLKLTVIENAEFLAKTNDHIAIIRISSTVQSCQHLIFADKMYSRFEQLMSGYMPRVRVIAEKIEESKDSSSITE